MDYKQGPIAIQHDEHFVVLLRDGEEIAKYDRKKKQWVHKDLSLDPVLTKNIEKANWVKN